MSRKEKLYARAWAYSNANSERGADSLSWEDGYRAALQDARKAVAEDIDYKEARVYPGMKLYLFPAIRKFLAPIR